MQIHHIDGNNSNNMFHNLAVLCLDCHSIVTCDEGLGRRYSAGEVTRYKAEWEQQCATMNYQDKKEDKNAEEDDEEDNEDEDDPVPADHHYEDSVIEANSDIARSYTLDEGDRVEIWMESDCALNFIVMDDEDYGDWDSGREVGMYVDQRKKYRLETTFVAPDDGEYAVVFYNDGDEEADVQLDILVWE